MRRTWTRRLLASSVACMLSASGVVAAVPAQAETATAGASSSLSVSPPTTEIDVTPGASSTQKVALDNLADVPQTIDVHVQNFAASGEQGQAALTDDENSPYSLTQWIHISPGKMTIPAHGHQEYQVKIDVPTSASPGGHFGALVFSPTTQSSPSGASLSVVAQVTSLVLLKVPGDAKEQANVASFLPCNAPKQTGACDKKSGFLEKGPVTFSLRVKNEGNIQIKPTGTITVRNIFGSKVATIPIEGKNVLPDSVRRFDTKWDHKMLFGMYKAKLEATYGSNQQTLTAETSFWAAPLATVGVALAIVVGVFLLLWIPRKRLRKALKALASND